MLSIPTALNDELLKEANFLAHLLEFELSSTVRYTDLDIDLLYGGNWWYARGMKLGAQEFSLSPTVDHYAFEVDNVNLEWSGYVLNEGVRGKKVIIRLIGLNDNYGVVGESIMFIGVINKVELDEQRARITLLSPLLYWRTKIPRRIHQALCPWPFKDSATCRYVGAETWCDQSYDRCVTLANTDNFGGFRFLPSLADKQFWWGQQPK